ncbi:hypothetical protein V5O48_018822 [Marasmius crinis-equi]|uniref:Uncharacterized protein n=1 Tax=Marasmius crinis-equi TaxID=585013 RepID=A0ABR3EK75_9AGAR
MVTTSRSTAAPPSTQHDIPPHMQHIPTRTSLEIPLFVGETVLSVERRDGLVITTTVKVEVEGNDRRPGQSQPSASVAATRGTADAESSEELMYPSTDDGSNSDDSLVVVDSSAPPPPNPVRSVLPGPPVVPVPTEFRRPANDTVFSKTDVITRLVEGVPNARRKAFGSWDQALWNYAAAYQGVHPYRQGMHNNTPGYKPQILRVAGAVNPLAASYTFGSGHMVGAVDISGLDLDADRLNYEVDIVPDE